MKIMVYEARPDERADLEKQAALHGVELSVTDAVPTLENASLAAGCIGVSILGQGCIDAALLDAYHALGIRYLSTRTIGYDHIDLDHARSIGLRVCSASYAPNGVADFTVMMILMCLRHYKQALWRGQVNDFSLTGLQGREMKDLTIGIIGTGLLTVTTFALAFLTTETSIVFLTVLYTVRMFSLSLVNMPINTWAMNALDNSLINHGTSVGNTLRQVAGSLGTAILVSVSTMATNMAAQTGMDGTHAGILGVNAAFFVGTLLCLIGLIITIVCVKDKPGERAAVDPDSRNRSTLERIMQRDVYTLPDTATVCDAVELFVNKHISAAPIVNAEGHAVGFISDGDVARVLAKRKTTFTDPVLFTQLTTDSDNDEFDDKAQRVMESNVCSIGARGVITVDVHTDLREVCRILGENHLKKIPVTDEGQLVGVVNRSDIAHYTMSKYLEARNQGEEAKPTEA